MLERITLQMSQVDPVRVLLWLVAAPFYAVGWAVGLVVAAVLFVVAAVRLGFVEARRLIEGGTDDVA